MMTKSVLLAVGLSVIFFIPRAQDHPVPGYIVRVSGDTVRGFLKMQGSDESAKQISFKASAGDKDYEVYTPAQVKAFRYNNGYLFRTVVFADTRTGAGGKAAAVTRICFGKLLVAGEYDLYSYTEQSWLYFLVRKDSTFYLLYDDDLQAAPYSHGNFRSELNFLASGCAAMSKEVESASYTEGGLRSFFQQLDGCLNPNQLVQSYHFGVKGHSGFLAYVGGMSYGASSQFTMEARWRWFWPQLDPNLSLNAGVRYVHMNRPFSGIQTDFELFSIPVTVQYDLDLLNGRVHPFAYAGFSLVAANISPQSDLIAYGRANGFVIGGGIAVKVYSCLWVRAELRTEYEAQIPTVGVAVILP
jgi:hypothetical protein